MFEKETRLAAVLELQSQRNLLDPSNPIPLVVDARGGKRVRVALQLVNGPEGMMELSIAGDMPWLEPETKRLTLVGGEKGDCIVVVRSDGDGEFGNLLFSWEGTSKTLSQSVMVQRQVAGSGSGTATQSPPASTGGAAPKIENSADKQRKENERKQKIETLKNYIKGMAPDFFISWDEEQLIFRKGGEMNFSHNETEAVLHKLCTEGGWTRESRLRESLKAQLIEATKDDGVVDRKELDQAVDFAVKRKMPRRDALELCITIMLDCNLKPARAGFFGGTIIDAYRKQFGL